MYSILIVGGGTAGWMAARWFNKIHPEINTTLIESKDIPTIGVGESTTPHFANYMTKVGLGKETEWMPQVDATYKKGVLYKNWNGIDSTYWNSFESDTHLQDIYPLYKENLKTAVEKSTYSGMTAFNDIANGSYKLDGGFDKGWYFYDYAYHVDAGKLVEVLKKGTTINHIYADITKVEHNSEGIKYVEDSTGERYEADLFIDSTGFKKLLISKVNANFTSLGPYLSHDKACVIPHPYADKKLEMKPRTKATALSSGWAWEIPLYSRIGAGYVYTSKYISDEEAEAEFREHLGADKVKDCKAFIVNMETGYYKEPLTKNVLAIGLSSGFIEPLEATMIASIFGQLECATGYINNEIPKEQVNFEFKEAFENFLDFIAVNYKLSNRRDTAFWRDKQEVLLSEKMEEWVALVKEEKEYTIPIYPLKNIFSIDNWLSKQISFGYSCKGYKPNKKEAAHRVREVEDKTKKSTILDMYSYLKNNVYVKEK